jgi:phosphoribosylanthranilate isomerase
MRIKLKICGIFRGEDVTYINEFPPDFAGFVFAESRRKVSLETAKKLIEKLSSDIIPVGVFVNETAENIVKIAEETNIKMIQLHGSEDDSFIKELKERISLPIIKAVKPNEPLTEFSDFLLFDGKNPGSGETFDRNSLPKTEKPWFLAGGINADNLSEAIALCPYGIDISSGVEKDGIKNREKIQEIYSIMKTGR